MVGLLARVLEIYPDRSDLREGLREVWVSRSVAQTGGKRVYWGENWLLDVINERDLTAKFLTESVVSYLVPLVNISVRIADAIIAPA